MSDDRHPSELPDADEVLDDDEHLEPGGKRYPLEDGDGELLSARIDVHGDDGTEALGKAEAPPPG